MRRIIITVLIAAGLISGGGIPAQAAASIPGAVVSATAIALPADLANRGTAVRVEYVTTDLKGALITATGLILTPRAGRTFKTVVWAHGTTGLADQCAPSANREVFWPEARQAVVALLARGHTVAAPDYPGLGTPAAHPYLVGGSEARSIIDIAKAARLLDARLTVQYAIDGHSQGGQGALFAGEIATAYDGALVLKGVAAIAPAAYLDVLAPGIAGTPGQGYLVMAAFGLSAVDSTIKPNQIFAPEARARFGVLQTGCLYEILAAFEGLTAEQLLIGGQPPAILVQKLAQYGNPGQKPPTAPILIVHGTEDEAVPYFISSDFLVPKLTSYGRFPVEFVTVQGANHDGAVFQTTGQVATWVTARLAG